MPLRIVYPICCGVDVHKRFLVATIAKTNEKNITEYKTESFPTLNSGLAAFRTWLVEHKCEHICMESTGKYWIPIYNVLEEAGLHVVLTHPKYVRAIKGQKTDKKDSKWIADLFKHDLIRSSIIPPKEFRAMREVARYRTKLVQMRSSEKNRYQNCMTVSNIGLGNILSDSLGMTSTRIIDYLLTSPEIDEEVVKGYIHRNVKASPEEIMDAVRDCKIEIDQQFKLRESRGHMEYLNAMIKRTEKALRILIEPHKEIIKHLAGMPGITELSASLIIAEIGVDMSLFDTSKSLVAWAGLSPTNNESAGKKKSVRVSKAGKYLKPIMVQCANAAVKDKKNPYFGIKYEGIKARRGSKKAIIAIARMMLTCIYNMIDTGEVFNPTDYDEVVGSNRVKKEITLTDDQAIEFLAAQGYDISNLRKPPPD